MAALECKVKHPAGLLLFPSAQSNPDGGQRVQRESAPRATLPGRARQRYLVLHLPAFALERCGFDASDLAVCVAESKQAMRLVSLTPAALKQGLCIGMTLGEARAQEPSILVHPFEPAEHLQDRQALLEAFSGFSDRLSLWGSQDLLMEISGVIRIFGGEQSLIEHIRSRAGELGHVCRVGVADDPHTAWAVATYAVKDTCVAVGQSHEALASLPFEALQPSGELAQSIRVLGIRTVGEWASLDAASVAGRFGKEGIQLHRIARGSGAELVPWNQLGLHRFAERAVLGEASSRLEPIYFVLPGLLTQLQESLEKAEALVVRLAVHLILERGTPYVLRLRVGQPTRQSERLRQVLMVRLEQLRLDAPVEEVLLEVEEHTKQLGWQPGLFGRKQENEPLHDVLARLTTAMGEGSVVGAVCSEALRPEHGWKSREFHLGEPLPLAVQHRRSKEDPVHQQRQWETQGPRPRPLCLLNRPERVELQVEQGEPKRVRLGGSWYSVERCEGPERLSGEWWSADGPWSRDYWVVRTSLGAGWCFCDRDQAWWWHGWFD